MSTTTPDPAASLQAKIGAFLATLEPAELDLFAAVVDRACADDVEGFSAPSVPLAKPIVRPASSSVLGSSVSNVIKNFGDALSTVARKG